MYGKANSATRVGPVQSFADAARVYEAAPKVRGEYNRRNLALPGARPTQRHWIERREVVPGLVLYRVYMFTTCIAEYRQDGTMCVSAGGHHHQPTTRDFVHALLPRLSGFVLAGNQGDVRLDDRRVTLYRRRDTYASGKASWEWRNAYSAAFAYSRLNTRKPPTPRVEFLFHVRDTVVFAEGV